MSNHSYIKLVPSSAKNDISIEEVKELFDYYKQITSKTATQVNWNYESSAFPYEIKELENKKNRLFLVSKQEGYQAIFIDVEQDSENKNEESANNQIKVTLPTQATYGDKGKANEFCKFLAKKLEGELHLFNGRVMYYYRRK